jgi:carbon monoxide dehydrogenase subunit G
VARAVRESAVLAADPETVWDTVMDPAQLERWVTAHDSLEESGPGPLSEGDEFTQRLRLAGKSFRVRWRVVEADRPRLAVWEGEGPGGSSAHVVYRLAAEDGGTRFEYENEFALPGGVLGRVAGGLLSAAPGGREARRSLERLQALLEA